jgi:hypothetical protein
MELRTTLHWFVVAFLIYCRRLLRTFTQHTICATCSLIIHTLIKIKHSTRPTISIEWKLRSAPVSVAFSLIVDAESPDEFSPVDCSAFSIHISTIRLVSINPITFWVNKDADRCILVPDSSSFMSLSTCSKFCRYSARTSLIFPSLWRLPNPP